MAKIIGGKINEFVKGDRLKSITTISRFKGIMNDLIRGYPAYLYFGIFEYYFKEKARDIIKFLEEDGLIKIIEPKRDGEPIMYRVTPKGIDFASSMAQLEYAQETQIFNRRIYTLTIIMVIFTIAVFFIGLAQLILTYLQNPIF